MDYAAVADGFGGEIGVAHDRDHEVVVDAHGVVRVLEEDAAVGVAVGMGSVVALEDQRVGLASSLLLQSMKSMTSGWSMLRITILAARRVLPLDLITPARRRNLS